MKKLYLNTGLSYIPRFYEKRGLMRNLFHNSGLCLTRTVLMIVALLMSFAIPSGIAQTTLSTTSTFSNNNGSGTVTFNLENTNASGIIITDIAGVTGSSGTVAVEMYYKTTPVNGSPGAIDAANGWTLVASGSITGVPNTSSTTTQPFLSGLNFTIPPNTTYGIAIFATGQRYYTISPANPVTISAGGVNFHSGPNIGYGGGTPPATPSNTPRGWIGDITFIPALPCVSPPTPGTASASASNICAGGSIQLSLSGNSMGTGQSYQWEGAATPNGPFTAIGAASPSPGLTTAVSSSTYFRAAVTCGASTAYSDTIFVSVPPLFPGGTYTIDASLPASPTNFQSFAAAASAINCGIAGPVVFNVAAGTYTNDQFLLDNINTSATNSITVNGNGATLSFVSTNSAERAGIRLDGTDHVTVNGLNIVATGTTTSEYGYGIHLTNDADSNTFANCTITVDTTIASTNYVPIVISGSLSSPTTSGSNCDGNTFTGNILNGGYYGITLYGNASAPYISNNVVTNNTIKNFYTYGVYLYGNDGTLVEGNDISRPTRTTSSTFAGVIFSGTNMNVTFTRNRIHNAFDMMPTSTSTSYIIYSSSSDATVGNENTISNNLIYDINSSGTIYGIYNAGSNYYRYYHNTISLDDINSATTSATRGIYQTTSATGLEFIDNIISIKRGGSGTNHGIYMNTAATTYTSNYNNIYVAGAGTNYFGYSGGAQATLSAWQTATSQDANSHELPPLFANAATGDYTPGNASLDNMGTFVGVTTDILNVSRSGSTPDIGAYEFTIPPCSGTPTAGTATINGSSSASACMGGNLALLIQGFSTGAGITFQWESSPVGMNIWSPIAGATNPTYNTTFSGPMDYRAGVTCLGGTSYSNTVTASQNPFYFCYCSPLTGTTLHGSTSNYINNVEIVNTSLNSSTSSVGPGGYYQSDPTIGTNTGVLSQGVPYTLIATHSSTSSSVNTEAWFDWDQSGTFDATEYYQLTFTGGSSTTTVTPPATAVLGMTGMRIRAVFSTTTTFGASGACANISVGRETEDYVITIAPPPTCFPPSGITVSPVTSTAATVNWTASSPAPGNGYEYYYSTSNTNPTSGTTPTGSVGTGITTVNLTGLTPVTTYYVWVRGNCSPTDKSTWTGPETFTTACAPFMAPYTHDVEAQTANTNSVMAGCWTSNPTNATGVYAWHVTGTGTTSSSNTGPNSANSGSKYFFTEASSGATDDTAVLTTPLVDVTTLSTPMLEFYYHMYGATINKLIVEVFNGTTWNAVDSIIGEQQTSETAPWLVRNVILNGYTGAIQARFTAVRGSSFTGDISLDDISFVNAPTCPAPTALTAATTSNSAMLGWTETGTATQWQIEYGPVNFTQGSGTLAFTTTNPHSLTGLNSSTSYGFYVRSVCGPNDTSAWSGPMTFATIPPNDTCQNAIDITNGQIYTGTTAGATQTLTSCNAATTFANDVWYSFTTGSVGGSVTVDVVTTGTMDVVMEGFSGTCGALTGMVPTASTTLTGTCIDGPAAGTEFGTYTVSPFTTYYIRVFGYTSAQGQFTIQATGTPLTVRLNTISATNVGDRNRIDWSTAAEDAGDFFELERSTDGRNYTVLTSVNAQGKPSAYSYWDAEPASGRNYYRLNMKTPNGGSTYSKVVTATVIGNGVFLVEAHPNPVTDKVIVKVTGQQGSGASVLLTDVSGKVITLIGNVGTETVIDMKALAGGLYFIRYSDSQHTESIRINKL